MKNLVTISLALVIGVGCTAQTSRKSSDAHQESRRQLEVLRTAQAAIAAGDAAVQKADLESASKEYVRALQFCRQITGDGAWLFSEEALKKLADVYVEQGQWRSAEPLLAERVKLLENRSESVGVAVGGDMLDLESCLLLEGQIDAARDIALRAIKFYEGWKKFGKETDICDRRIADSQGMLGIY